MGCEISDHCEIVESELVKNQPDVSISGTIHTGDLHDQRHRITKLFFKKNHENPRRLSIRRSRPQTVMARIAKHREKMDNVNSELEFGDESNGDHFRGTTADSGIDRKLNYTKYLTRPLTFIA